RIKNISGLELVEKLNQKSAINGSLPEKEFKARNSVLTDLFEQKHGKTIYNIFITILVMVFINKVIYDYFVFGKLSVGLNLIQWSFQGPSSIFCLWLQMFATTLIMFFCFHFWANQRIKYIPNTLGKKCWDYGWLCAFISYEILLLSLPAMKLLEHFVPPVLSVALLLDQIRMMMKTYAFVRTNTPKALAYKPHQSGDEKETSPCPEFSKYLYFLFAPVLVYRDNYPRYAEIRWKFVTWYFMEVIVLTFYLAFIYEKFFIPIHKNFGLPDDQKTMFECLIVGIFASIIPSTMMLILLVYILLHSWMNGFAEMLRYADRMFYQDWWNSTSYAVFFRKWNVLVQDWLFTYIYKDVPFRKRWISMLTVILISALFHEYAFTLALRYFFPVVFIEFAGIG
ncbi:hypothetical protein L9F63_022999, partial [Diploptera punctata]